MFAIPTEFGARLIFFVFSGLLCAVLALLAVVYAEVIADAFGAKLSAAKPKPASREKQP